MKNLINILLVVMAVMTTASCTDALTEIEANLPQPGTRTPEYFIPVDGGTVDIYFNDESVIRTDHRFIVNTEDTIRVAGQEGIEATEALRKVAEDTLTFAYNYDINNEVTVEGLTMPFTYEGVSYEIPCGVELTVLGHHNVVESSSEPAFYELSETDYILSYGELELAGATQVFVVEEGYVSPTVDHIDWAYRHIAFQRNAGLKDNVVSVLCNNVAEFAEVMSDGSRQNVKKAGYIVNNLLSLSVPTLSETEIAELDGTTVEFIDGIVELAGKELSCKWLSASIEDEVVYQDKNYAEEITPCTVTARTISFNKNAATIVFYDEDEADYAELTISIDGTPVPVYDRTEWSYRHIAFQRQATLVDGVVNVFCDNAADFVEIYTDSSEHNAETVDYVVLNRFTANIPVITVDNLNEVVGKTFVFANGVANVVNQQVTLRAISSAIEGKVEYRGKDYTEEIIPCEVEPKTITFNSTSEATVVFYDEKASDYAELVLAVTVKESTEVLERTEESYIHKAFRRNASVSGSNFAVVCDNEAVFTDVYSKGTTITENVDYTVVNNFRYSVPEIFVGTAESVVGKTFSFNAGKAVVEGYNVSVNFVSREISDIMHNGKNYSNNTPKCEVEVVSITFTSTTGAEITCIHNNETVIATITVKVVENTVAKVDWAHRHEAFRREATMSNNTINVFCDNVADFVQVMSDSSRQNEESVDYVVVNRFTASVPEIQATADDGVVGNTYNFNNGEVTVCGTRISAQHISAEVEGSVMYQGTDYASEITPCEAAARTITFTSASEAVIRFYNEDSKDYAEATISVIVVPYEEPVTVVDVARAYQHVAFRSNAVVANNTISVVCDNEAVQTTTMSDGTSSKATANYTWTNRFLYSMPSIPASVKGQSFRFNAGTAVVEGYNVTVNFSSREVSAIVFNGTDYRSEAPVCQVNVATITFGEGSATITFEHDNETISATIPVNYIEAEIISGEIMGMWITDAYQGRSLMSTDLHILARNNDGSYTVYSRGVNETSFTTTQLTASEGQSILSSGRSIAWVWTGASWVIGTMYYETSSDADLGYRIDYYDLAGGLALRLGVMEGTINGEPFPEPLKATGIAEKKATGIAENGVWSINYNGSVNYFIGSIL